MTKVRIDLFDSKAGFDRGRPRWIEATWYVLKMLFFLSPIPWPSKLRCSILRAFGAKVGTGVNIKPRVNIHLPWKLRIGDFSWVGEEVFLLNFEPISIGSHCCISQRAFLCAGNHDYSDPSFAYRNRPITIEDGAWIGAQAFVAPGVTVGEDAVATAGSVVTKDLPAGMVCVGNPCTPIKPRWKSA